MKDIVNLINHKKSAMALSFILCLCLAGPGALQTAYGQGTLVETVGTMEIQQQVEQGVNQSAPKGPMDVRGPASEANVVTEQPNRAPMDAPGRPNPAETPMAAPAMIADTNVPDVNDFNTFKQEIDRIDIEARGEDTRWLDKQEKKAELAKAMDEVVVAELKFLRKVADAANDTKTRDAIDLVLKKRQDRLNKLVAKLENEVREERRQQATERRERKTPRAGAGGQEQPQTERTPRERQPKRLPRNAAPQE